MGRAHANWDRRPWAHRGEGSFTKSRQDKHFTERTQLWCSASPREVHLHSALGVPGPRGSTVAGGGAEILQEECGWESGWGGQRLSWPSEILSGSLKTLRAGVFGQLAEGTFSSNLDLPLGNPLQKLCAYSWSACRGTPVFENSVCNRFWWKPVLFNTQDTLGARFFYYPCLETRRLWFRDPTSPAKDHTPMEWESWHSSSRLLQRLFSFYQATLHWTL